jgi:hypothetical protein
VPLFRNVDAPDGKIYVSRGNDGVYAQLGQVGVRFTGRNRSGDGRLWPRRIVGGGGLIRSCIATNGLCELG